MTAMKTLLVMRHAKSSWSDPDLSDHDRPLNARGKGASDRMAIWLRDEGLMPDQILSSDSARTTETAARMAAQLPDLPRPVFSAALYHASADMLLEVSRGAGDNHGRVLVLAHQPGISTFCARLARHPVAAEAARAFHHFPTAAIAVFNCDISSWRELSYSTCEFIRFTVPRELA